MFVVEKAKGEMSSLHARELSFSQIKSLSSQLAQKIALEIAKKPSYAMEIAKKLKVNEQKVYYHIRKLEKARIIEVSRTETIQGAYANIYSITEPAFVIKLREFQTTQKIAFEKQPT